VEAKAHNSFGMLGEEEAGLVGRRGVENWGSVSEEDLGGGKKSHSGGVQMKAV